MEKKQQKKPRSNGQPSARLNGSLFISQSKVSKPPKENEMKTKTSYQKQPVKQDLTAIDVCVYGLAVSAVTAAVVMIVITIMDIVTSLL